MPGFNVITSDYSYNPRGNSYKTEYYYKYTFYIGNEEQNVGLKSCTLPTISIAKGQILGGSIEYKYAKTVSFDDVNITYYDTQDHLGYWKSRVEQVWSDGALNPVDEYKQAKNDIWQSLPTDIEKGRRRYTLHNVWPSSVKYGDLSYTDSDINNIQITLTYDWMVVEDAVLDPSLTVEGL